MMRQPRSPLRTFARVATIALMLVVGSLVPLMLAFFSMVFSYGRAPDVHLPPAKSDPELRARLAKIGLPAPHDLRVVRAVETVSGGERRHWYEVAFGAEGAKELETGIAQRLIAPDNPAEIRYVRDRMIRQFLREWNEPDWWKPFALEGRISVSGTSCCIIVSPVDRQALIFFGGP